MSSVENAFSPEGSTIDQSVIDRFTADVLSLPIPENIGDIISVERDVVREQFSGRIPQEDLLVARSVFHAPDVSSYKDARYMLTFALAAGSARRWHREEANNINESLGIGDAIENVAVFMAGFKREGRSAEAMIKELEREGKNGLSGVLHDLVLTRNRKWFAARTYPHDVSLRNEVGRHVGKLIGIERSALGGISDTQIAEAYVHDLRRKVIGAFSPSPLAAVA